MSTYSGIGNSVITCTAVANGDDIPYMVVVTFVLEDGTTSELPIVVDSFGADPATIAVSPTSKTFLPSGGSLNVEVVSNKAWVVSCDQSWLVLSTTRGVGTGSFQIEVGENSSMNTEVADVIVSTLNGEVVKIVKVLHLGHEQEDVVQGHSYVDLGLPSGTLWATCNVGSTEPEGWGDFFAWGEIEPKLIYDYSTYKYALDYNQLLKYCDNQNFGLDGYVDNIRQLEFDDDAASMNWGDSWRIPTSEEQTELVTMCEWTWDNQEDVNGFRVTGPNGNSIFLPASGIKSRGAITGRGNTTNYRSSSVGPSNNYIFSIRMTPDHNVECGDQISRDYGMPIRAVVANHMQYSEYLSVAPLSKSVAASGERFDLTLTTNGLWNVSCDKSWVKTFENEGIGDNTLSVYVEPNESSDADTAFLQISLSSKSVVRTLKISRAGNRPMSGSSSGHSWVDLGLPSGTLWATCNLGSSSPENYGDYYSWGETNNNKRDWFWISYKYGSAYDQLTKYCTNSYYGKDGYTDNITSLEPSDDVAKVKWGTAWGMPSKAQIYELLDCCRSEWISIGGKYGRRLTGPNGNSVFFPAAGEYVDQGRKNTGTAGYYWSGELSRYLDNPYYAECFRINEESMSRSNGYRCEGFTVRAVLSEYARLDADTLYFGSLGDSHSVNVESNVSWSVASNKSWCTMSRVSGTNNGSFMVMVEPNLSNVPDSAIVKVTSSSGAVKQIVNIIREASMGE